jgi:beta-glucosidase-like glycosyl hydrolase
LGRVPRPSPPHHRSAASPTAIRIADRDLLVDTLRNEWGFEGTIVSDYNGVEELVVTHRLVPTLTEAAAASLEAGIDVELPTTAGYGSPLKSAVESGWIDEAIVDRSVARVLRQKFRLGLFEDRRFHRRA